MRFTVSGPVTKLCPFKDEVDHGSVTLEFMVEEGPELHDLASRLDYRNRKISHEAFTQEVYDAWAGQGCVSVQSSWTTAGLTVRCAVPGD